MDQAEASRAAAARVFEIADAPMPVTEPIAPHQLPTRADLAMEAVGFRYGTDLPWVLDGFELAVPDGGRVAISGPSGSGKSTIVDLLLRFREPERGRLRIGGVDITTVRGEDVRSRFTVVPQHPYLFHGTLRDNLLVARGDADDEALLKALRWAALDDLLATAPAGLDTMVGERGVRLSGGERQRVAMARMWLKDAPIVILDEATAHLDQATEATILARLDVYLRGRTAVILAHRSALLNLAGERLDLTGPGSKAG
jgi:ATP-binding cassette subfamily C protein CydC